MPRIELLNFTGLVRDRDLRDLTQTEIINALRLNGWVEHSDDDRKYDDRGNVIGRLTHKSGGRVHFVSQLVKRGADFGILTLGHLARGLRDGSTEDGGNGRKLRFLPSRRAFIVYVPEEGWLITFCPA